MKDQRAVFQPKNLVLDFLDRANREIYHLYDNVFDDVHVNALVEALTVATFLCGEFCITAPGPVAECHLSRQALVRRAAYLHEGLIRFPLREGTVEEFIEKKQREYRLHRAVFSGLYDANAAQFFKQFAAAFIPRSVRVGRALAVRLEAGPDEDEIWRPLQNQLSSRQIHAVGRIAKGLVENGFAITWEALCDHLPNRGRGLELARVILQHYYFKIYLAEYDATVLNGVPFAQVDLDLGQRTLGYDYRAIGHALRACGLWNAVKQVSAESMLRMRTGGGYLRFRSMFDEMCGRCSSVQELRTRAGLARNVALPEARYLERFDVAQAPTSGWLLTRSELEAFDVCLDAFAEIRDRGETDQPARSARAQVTIVNYGEVKLISGDQMQIGDRFEKISQSIIATRESIATGIVRVECEGQKELAAALAKIETAISAASHDEMSPAVRKDALDLLDELTKHAGSQDRAVAVTKSIADGLWEKVKSVASVAKTASEVWPIVQHLWK